ncbi:MAG: sugar phosphate isomerase/epimerase, partial [Oscillospiraceae bacterium]|nr:sugar phosphate isomerase/epimerase [Oscillospiraceae bacterium]
MKKMKLGISTYCLNNLMENRKMTLGDVIDWAAKNGAECVELVPFAYKFETDDGKIDYDGIRNVKRRAADAGITLENYSVLANLCETDADALRAEIARVKRHVDIAAELGLSRMRHDISSFRRSREENALPYFEKLFPQMTDAAGEIADHASRYGITTLLENHGFFVNGADRTERLVRAVDRANYAILMDTGNVVCVDEDPEAFAIRAAPITRMIHLKDFYIRRHYPGDATEFDCAGSWFKSMAGRYLRGSILHQGDLDVPR